MAAAYRVTPRAYAELRRAQDGQVLGYEGSAGLAKRAERVRAIASKLAQAVAKDSGSGKVEDRLLALAAWLDFEGE